MAFTVDKTVVKKKYFELSKKYHPDFVNTSNAYEVEQAEETLSAINKAYKIFNNDDELVKYILELKEYIQSDEKYELPKDFLMEMMETNEALMDAKFENDIEKIEQTKQIILSFQESIVKSVENILKAQTIENITSEDFLKVKEYYFKKKYLNRILEGI